jgi:3-oxoadipate enol-lactonase
MPRMDVNGTTLHYEITGPLGAPVVALSNSLATDLRMWDPQTGPLSAHYCILRYDTRGHGQSPPTAGPYGMEQLADDWAALLDKLGVRRAHLVGLSLGGMTAQVIAARRPDLVASLCLVATSCAPPMASRAAWHRRAEEARGIPALGDEVAEAMLDRWLTRRFRRHHPANAALVRAMILGTPPEGYAGCCDAIAGLDMCGRLGGLRAPVWVVAGEEDPGTTVEDAERIQDGIPGAELTVLPHARHLLNWDPEAAFTPLLLAWLARVAAA